MKQISLKNRGKYINVYAQITHCYGIPVKPKSQRFYLDNAIFCITRSMDGIEPFLRKPALVGLVILGFLLVLSILLGIFLSAL